MILGRIHFKFINRKKKPFDFREKSQIRGGMSRGAKVYLLQTT